MKRKAKDSGIDTTAKQLKSDSEQQIKNDKLGKSSPSTNKGSKLNQKFKKKPINKTFLSKGKLQKQGKPNWVEVKKRSKDLKVIRKGKRNNLFDVIQQAKTIWEEIRCAKCPKEKSKELTTKLVKLLSGKLSSVVHSHDASRIVQWLMILGSEEIKTKVVSELIGNIILMAESRYAHHTVQAILKYGTQEIRQMIIDKFYGNIVLLLNCRFSAPLIDEIYNKYASKHNKIHMRQELFSDLYKGTKNNNISSLTDVFNECPDLKEAVLSSTKAILLKLLDKDFAVSCSIVHSVLYDYLCHCNTDSKVELMDLIHSKIKSFLFTKDGAKVARMVMWTANNKVKKTILKALKSDFKDICLNEHGCMFLPAMIDSVDDTVLLSKCFLPAILANAEEIANNEYGRKVLFYLLAHRNPAYFHPADLEILKQAEKSEHIKKDCSRRMEELLEHLMEQLLNNVCSNPSFWLSNGKIGMVTLAILKSAAASKKPLENAYNVISDYITNDPSFGKEDMEENIHSIIEDSGLHMVFKKLIQFDKECKDTDKKSFSESLTLKLSDDVLEHWIVHNRGCFILVLLMETQIDTVVLSLNLKLKKKKLKNLLGVQETKGAQILKKYILD